MIHTKWRHVLVWVLPFRSGLSRRLRRHLERCPECLDRMADVRQARSVTISARELGRVEDIWPRLAPKLGTPSCRESEAPKAGWAWALGTAGLLALAVVGAFFLAPLGPTEVLSAGVKLRVNYVRMYEEPAQAFIFRTQDADSTFVWVEKPKPGEVL